MYIESFKRIEKKFILNQSQYENFLKDISSYMIMDNYGEHTICNLYFDTDNYYLIRKSLEKPIYKEKLRLRSYGIPEKTDNTFLEIKKKYKEIVYKRRISAPLNKIEDYVYENKELNCENKQILNEIDYFKKFYNVTPKVYLAYDRIAFYNKENPNLRMTIDKNIRSRITDLDLSKGDYGKLLLPENTYVLEIKIDNAYPIWLVRLLNNLQIYQTSFSKYGEVYKELLKDNQISLFSELVNI